MITCLILDDQIESVDLIKDHIKKIPSLTILYASTNPSEALSFIDNNQPDIIFIDIEMPEITGIDFIESVKNRLGNYMPKFVFITGYTDYALTGYEHGVVDYLLKPVSFIRFKKCVDRILDDLNKQINKQERQDYFFIEDEGKKLKINFNEIVYIEAAGNYIILVTLDFKKVIYKSMVSIQEILPQSKFIRVHKSYIVASNRIFALNGNEIILDLKNQNKNIPIGITYKEDLMKHLGIS